MTPKLPDPASPDPAKRRFFIIQGARLGGVLAVIAGLLLFEGRLGSLPPSHMAGGALLGAGLILIFLMPAVLIRRWKTPE